MAALVVMARMPLPVIRSVGMFTGGETADVMRTVGVIGLLRSPRERHSVVGCGRLHIGQGRAHESDGEGGDGGEQFLNAVHGDFSSFTDPRAVRCKVSDRVGTLKHGVKGKSHARWGRIQVIVSI